ncbi:5-bromo-4-chloroindolyl phosphate hydrolysis family protein [Rhodobacter maris]|uniref:5-bromo-4-chloroindolyl phosphate hydrolysis protein n=1 Tax=Rhodobacter maris TaxID=446682 RepID=A0A285SRN6_9RHOB|nr:5-bromo-4-chloroindolyl phosphate hydrolysis family protein [Rhodobacter maris]SOC10943.1 5-bromo-4-chloroindolyl phosphate hydrolysis protein [Rhodobacter maris]
MAKRYGGKYSPSPNAESRGYAGVAPDRLPETGPAHPMTRRLVWLVVAALPFLFNAFGAGPLTLARSLGSFALIAGAVFLIREGLKAEAAWQARKVARRPVLPRKAFGALGIGLGLGLGAQAPEIGALGAGLIGLIGAALSLFAFGLDPMRDKGLEGVDPFQQDRVSKVVTEGERELAAMAEAIARADDARLTARVAAFAETAHELFRAVEEDPGDLGAARRYLTVYLSGARAASEKYAGLTGALRDAKARAEYEALLDDLEANYAARTRALRENDRVALEIEVEVLRERLAREGLREPR